MAKTLFAIAFCLFASLSSLNTNAASTANTAKKPPIWAELSVEQKEILRPLEDAWDTLDARRRQKWLGIAKRYPNMKSEEQAKVQAQMQPWANLTPEQRNLARERYKKLEKLPADKKLSLRDQWEQYQQLPEEERQRLRAAGKAPRAPQKEAGSKSDSPRSQTSKP